MELEISIEDLLNKNRIEKDRIEFKASWNPDDIYRSVCAFANDYDNIGGGYICVGVEEENGVAVRPVKGISEYEIDGIQKEILGYNNSMIPSYFPKVIVEEVDGKILLVLWVPTGNQRPYKVPEHVTSKKEKKPYYYIRYATSSIRPNPEQERELLNMTNYAPFDTRPNFEATEDDISVPLLIEHLKATKSKLAKQILKRGVMEILGDMQLLVGPLEQQYLSNVALMMFCEHLDKFFPYTQVEITRFTEGSINNPNNFIEIPVIKGSVPMMIKKTMDYIKTMVIEEKVTKVNYQMEAIRRFNYPYLALEEAVVNAFYHRDYMSGQSIIIEIEPEFIRIISFPGIDRSIPMRVIESGERFSTRYYRNRRLGEFLKELDLSEGKSTGVPTIQEELRNNGSPKAKFLTDEDRRAIEVIIPIHPDFIIESQIGDSDSKSVIEEMQIGDSDSKSTIREMQIGDSDSKLAIEKPQTSDSDAKSVIEDLQIIDSKKKSVFDALVDTMHYKDRVKNNIKIVYEQFRTVSFGRKDVVEATNLSYSSAGDLISCLHEYDLIEPVKGQGKGKYRFI